MPNYIKRNPFLFGGVLIAVLISLFLVNHFGFWGMHKTITPMPERLRDMTFPVWDKYSCYKHGFLVFLTKDDFGNGVAYSNHSTAYLFFMYIFYKVEMMSSKLPMRVVVAYLEMLFFVFAIFKVTLPNLTERVKLNHTIMILLALIYLVTMPDFWLSAGKFNVDNPFHLLLTPVLLIAYRLASGESSGYGLWLPLVFLCVFSPISSALLGAYLIATSLTTEAFIGRLSRLGFTIVFLSVAVYLQPVLFSKILHFSSSNSSWIFRAGLDGDTSSFNNVINSFLRPFYPRPAYLIVAPICLLVAQLVSIYFTKKLEKSSGMLAAGVNSKMFYGVLFSQYLITILLWPQSVSIHPYLYDFLLIGPVYVWILLNFVWSPVLLRFSGIWTWVLLFFISFNLQQIAQANKCFYCFYPPWEPIQYVIEP